MNVDFPLVIKHKEIIKMEQDTSSNNSSVDEETRKANLKVLTKLFYHQFVEKDNQNINSDIEKTKNAHKKLPLHKCEAIIKAYGVIPSYVKVGRMFNCNDKVIKKVMKNFGDLVQYEDTAEQQVSFGRKYYVDADKKLNLVLGKYVNDHLKYTLDVLGKTSTISDTTQEPILSYTGTLEALKPIEKYISTKEDSNNALALMNEFEKHLKKKSLKKNKLKKKKKNID